jgi:hypothetical protein
MGKKCPVPYSKAFEAWRKTAGPDDVYRVVVLPDMQVPYQDDRALAAVERYMKDVQWDEYINLGDFVDLDHISTHSKGKLRQIEGKTIQADYDVANTILDRHQTIVRKRNPDAAFTLLEGNHEYRIERLIDEQPQLKGSLEIEKGLRLKQRGFNWIRCYQKGELYRVGNSYFSHGKYCSGNHAKTHVERFGVNITYGHTHDVMTWPKVLWGKGRALVGQSLGCLCRFDLDYIGQDPTNWAHAIGEYHFRANGDFNYYVIRIFDAEFVAPNGKVYRP